MEKIIMVRDDIVLSAHNLIDQLFTYYFQFEKFFQAVGKLLN